MTITLPKNVINIGEVYIGSKIYTAYVPLSDDSPVPKVNPMEDSATKVRELTQRYLVLQQWTNPIREGTAVAGSVAFAKLDEEGLKMGAEDNVYRSDAHISENGSIPDAYNNVYDYEQEGHNREHIFHTPWQTNVQYLQEKGLDPHQATMKDIFADLQKSLVELLKINNVDPKKPIPAVILRGHTPPPPPLPPRNQEVQKQERPSLQAPAASKTSILSRTEIQKDQAQRPVPKAQTSPFAETLDTNLLVRTEGDKEKPALAAAPKAELSYAERIALAKQREIPWYKKIEDFIANEFYDLYQWDKTIDEGLETNPFAFLHSQDSNMHNTKLWDNWFKGAEDTLVALWKTLKADAKLIDPICFTFVVLKMITQIIWSTFKFALRNLIAYPLAIIVAAVIWGVVGYILGSILGGIISFGEWVYEKIKKKSEANPQQKSLENSDLEAQDKGEKPSQKPRGDSEMAGLSLSNKPHSPKLIDAPKQQLPAVVHQRIKRKRQSKKEAFAIQEKMYGFNQERPAKTNRFDRDDPRQLAINPQAQEESQFDSSRGYLFDRDDPKQLQTRIQEPRHSSQPTHFSHNEDVFTDRGIQQVKPVATKTGSISFE